MIDKTQPAQKPATRIAAELGQLANEIEQIADEIESAERAQPAQEPVAEVKPMFGGKILTTISDTFDLPVGTKLYAAPVLRELSDEEILSLWGGQSQGKTVERIMVDFARAVLATARSKA